MNCPICGREITPDVKVCPHCATRFQTLKTSLERINRPAKRPASPILIRLSCAIMAVVIAVFGILVCLEPEEPNANYTMGSLPVPGPSILPTATQSATTMPLPSTGGPLPTIKPVAEYCSTSSSVVLGSSGGTTNIVFDGKTMISTTQSIQNYSHQSISGETKAVRMADRSLYIAMDGQLIFVDENVENNYSLSALGRGIVYSVQLDDFSYELRLYLPLLEQKYSIFKYQKGELLEYVISPGGSCVAYRYHNSNTSLLPQLACFRYGETSQVAACSDNLIAISGKGEYIYTYAKYSGQVLRRYSYNGEYKELAYGVDNTFYLNIDHTQILFYKNGKTWMYEVGYEPSAISDFIVRPVLPPDACIYYNDRCRTYPYVSFHNTVFYADHSRFLYYIDRYLERLLATQVQGYALAPGGEQLFYIQANALYVVQVNQEAQPILLDKGTDIYQIKLSPCFYESPNGRLIGFSYTRSGSVLYGWYNLDTSESTILDTNISGDTILDTNISGDFNSSGFIFGKDGFYFIRDSQLHIYTPQHQTILYCDPDFLLNIDGMVVVCIGEQYYFVKDSALIHYHTMSLDYGDEPVIQE